VNGAAEQERSGCRIARAGGACPESRGNEPAKDLSGPSLLPQRCAVRVRRGGAAPAFSWPAVLGVGCKLSRCSRICASARARRARCTGSRSPAADAPSVYRSDPACASTARTVCAQPRAGDPALRVAMAARRRACTKQARSTQGGSKHATEAHAGARVHPCVRAPRSRRRGLAAECAATYWPLELRLAPLWQGS